MADISISERSVPERSVSGKKADYTFYLVTDSGMCPREKIPALVEQSIAGGATIVQLREKNIPTRVFYEEAKALNAVARQYDVPLIINDRLDIALAVDCGLHVGQDDMPVETARKLLGPDRVIGVSAGSLSEAVAAERGGADYVGVGSFFPTETKKEAPVLPLAALSEIRQSIRIPIVAIGGINQKTLPSLRGYGLDGIAVVSAVMRSPDPENETRLLKNLFETLR